MRRYQKTPTRTDHGRPGPEISLQLINFAAQHIVDVDDILQQIDKIPSYHLERLKEICYDPQRLLPKIIPDRLEGLHRDAKGAFIQNHRTIVIHDIHSPEQFFHLLFHELGHHVYFQVIGSKIKKKWVTGVYRKQGFVSRYAATNAAEDFAECYASYLLEPDTLKQISNKFHFFREHVFNQQCYLLQSDRIDFSA